MRRSAIAIVLATCTVVFCKPISADGPSPRLLPPANHFRLTLREKKHSKLPLGPGCDGVASVTLTCQAFTLRLENQSKQTIRIYGLHCPEPAITILRKELRSSSGWWPVSYSGGASCDAVKKSVRLKPGGRANYETRLITARRVSEGLDPGSYVLRAEWVLFGCTDKSGSDDCITDLQNDGHWPQGINNQQPVTAVSNEIKVDSSPISGLGKMKFAFKVAVVPSPAPILPRGVPAKCKEAADVNIDCVVFHYSIRNNGDRPVRNFTFSCSDSDIYPEYRTVGGDWKLVPQIIWECTMNIGVETKILPGEETQGDFTLPTLAPGYDTASLRNPGEHEFRFIFQPRACIASSDAGFCLFRPKEQAPVISEPVLVRVLAQSTLGHS